MCKIRYWIETNNFAALTCELTAEQYGCFCKWVQERVGEANRYCHEDAANLVFYEYSKQWEDADFCDGAGGKAIFWKEVESEKEYWNEVLHCRNFVRAFPEPAISTVDKQVLPEYLVTKMMRGLDEGQIASEIDVYLKLADVAGDVASGVHFKHTSGKVNELDCNDEPAVVKEPNATTEVAGNIEQDESIEPIEKEAGKKPMFAVNTMPTAVFNDLIPGINGDWVMPIDFMSFYNSKKKKKNEREVTSTKTLDGWRSKGDIFKDAKGIVTGGIDIKKNIWKPEKVNAKGFYNKTLYWVEYKKTER